MVLVIRPLEFREDLHGHNCMSQSQVVVLLQTAHCWANAGVFLGARMHRERVSFRSITMYLLYSINV